MHVRARTVCFLVVAWLAAATSVQAQVPRATADSVARALQALTARLDSIEAGTCPTGPAVTAPGRRGEPRTDSLIATLESLTHRLEAMRAARCAPGAAPPPAGPAPPPGVADSSDDLAAIRAAAAAAAGGGAPAPAAGAPADTTAPPKTEFVGKQRNAAALNPEISATGDIRLVAREGRQRDNGVAREFEFAFQSALDPYSNTKIFLTFEDEEVGVEEGYIYWTGLPGRLRRGRRQVPPADRRPQPLAPARAARNRVPAGLSALPLARRADRGRRCRSTPRCRSRSPAAPTRSGCRPPRRRATRSTPVAASRRCSSDCRTSGSSPAAPTPSSASPAPAATTPTPICGAGSLGSTSGSPIARPRRAPAGRSPSAPKAIGSTRRSWAPPPTATAPSWTSTPSSAGAGSSARATITSRRRAAPRTPNGG